MYNREVKLDLIKSLLSLRLYCCNQSFFVGLLDGNRLRLHVKITQLCTSDMLLLLEKLKPEFELSIKKKGARLYIRGLDMFLLRKRFVQRTGKNSMLKNPRHCYISFLKGLFVAYGYIQDPAQGYHLELRIKGRWKRVAFKYITKRLRLKFNCFKTKGRECFYLKSNEKIMQFLNLLGQFDKASDLSEIVTTRSLLSEVNRQVNLETANINKVVKASETTISNIKFLLGLEDQSFWTHSLYATAMMRLKYPQDSIEDLGQRFTPSLSKSAINHRLRRINAIYAKKSALSK